jgi:hypothetical protein
MDALFWHFNIHLNFHGAVSALEEDWNFKKPNLIFTKLIDSN